MKGESIEDIFKELDLLEKELELDNAVSEDRLDSNSAEGLQQGKSQFSPDFFFDIAQDIKQDEYFKPIANLVKPHYYDFIDFDECLLKEKYELKTAFLSIYYKYRFLPKHYNIKKLDHHFNSFKHDDMFVNDHFIHTKTMDIYLKKGKAEEGLGVVLDFFRSQIYCDEAVLQYIKFCLDIFMKKEDMERSGEIDYLVSQYENNRHCYKSAEGIPIAERIYNIRSHYYLLSEEKYEFNQSLALLMNKAVVVGWHCPYEYSIRFYANLMDCEILYLKYLAYIGLGYVSKRLRSSKFDEYLSNAMEDKENNGNMLMNDFERIYSCKQIEIDYLHSFDEMENKNNFDELFSDEYRR